MMCSEMDVLAIRAGFGLFFDAINANIVGVGEPYHYTATYSQPNGSFSNPLLGQNPIPANYVKGNPQFAGPYTVNFADKNLTTPYTEAFNIGIQQRVRQSGTFEINYVGKLGRHQIIQFDMNPAIYDCSGGYFQSNPTTYCADASTASASYRHGCAIPAGGSAVACANDIPTFKGAHFGDGCLPDQATLNAPSSTAIDAYGNIYISDNGTTLLRVIYQGRPGPEGDAYRSKPGGIRVGASAGPYLYTRWLSAAKSGSRADLRPSILLQRCGYRRSGPWFQRRWLSRNPGYVQPRGIAVDANGNVFFANPGW